LPETALIDRQADTNFIEHLLDSFGSLQITSPAPHGSLESFGLNPPAFAFRWKTPTHSYELRLGFLVKTQGGNNIERYMTLDGISVHIASGTTLRLIEQIQSIQSLRKKEWTTLDADDIDEIEIFRPAFHPSLRPVGAKTKAKRALFAQREGDRWTNQQHQALSADISSFLIFLSGSPVLQFIDSKTQVRQILNHLPQAYEVKLTDRSGKKTSLSLWLQGQKVYGQNSTRPEGVFQLNPKVLSALTALSAPPDR
jgi:hypothetical protein